MTRKKNSRKQQKTNRKKEQERKGPATSAANRPAGKSAAQKSESQQAALLRQKELEKKAAAEANAVLEDITEEIDSAFTERGAMTGGQTAASKAEENAAEQKPVETDSRTATEREATGNAASDSLVTAFAEPEPVGISRTEPVAESETLEINWHEDTEERKESREENGEDPIELAGLNSESAAEPGAGTVGVWQKVTSFLKGLWEQFCRQKLWVRIVSCVVAVILVIVLAGYGYFHSKYRLMKISDGMFSSSEISAESDSQDQLENEELQSRQASGQLDEKEVVEATGDIWSDSDVFNILLIGTDDRTTEFSDNARGDTCILLSINKATNQIHLVSFERAIGVKILSGEYEGQWDWLTHMFWYGGPYLMTREIRENFKVDVTKYIRVNIHTFMELVDSVGGVDIDMTEAECNNINHPEGTFTAGNIKGMHVEDVVQQDLVPGVNHLNGATAMCYARLRAIDDDWHRVERQRKVILAAVENLKKLSLTELDSLLNNVLPLVQTNLTEADIAGLLPEAGTFVNMDYDTITFPLKHTYGLMDGMCSRKVLALDFDTNAQELQRFLNGETTAAELTDKYENSDLGSYSYKNSESYQQNYEDAETVVGQGTYIQQTGKSKPTLVTSGTSSNGTAAQSSLSTQNAEEESATQTGSEETAAGDGQESSASSSASLGVVESTSTDPATGVVTVIYYNAETGVRTAIAANPASGAATVTANDTTTGGTASAHVEGTTGTTETTDASAAAAGMDAAATVSDTAAQATDPAAAVPVQ